MAERKNEPQSYGSQNEWLTGETGQEVNRLKGNPNSQRADFYVNAPNQDETFDRDPVAKADEDDEEPTQKVTSLPSGAKRDSYFKKRDY